MKLVYEIKEVRQNIICRWYNLEGDLAIKIFKCVIKEAQELIKKGDQVKVYLSAKGK